MTDPQYDSDSAFSSVDENIGSQLLKLLISDEIVPGSAPSYELCKIIFSYHPLGAILTDAPISRAMAKPREISIPVLGESRLQKRYNETWKTLGKLGGTVILHNLFSAARMYGIASLAVGEVGKSPSTPLDPKTLAKADLFFNIFDPLNTAGSLVLDQNPNSPNYLKPSGPVFVAGQLWHPSRIFTKLHEQPLYIDYTTSAFGFVGRSVYQRALYPLKSFVQSMITDQLVVQKAGLLVYKAQSPTSFMSNLIKGAFGQKRRMIKAGNSGNVLSIGTDEAIETLNMINLDSAFTTARTNILKNVASAARMPASIMAQETLTEGFGEGDNDMRKEIEYLDRIREEMDPGFQFLDAICQRKAWTPEFYDTMAEGEYGELKRDGFDGCFFKWQSEFAAGWPNLMVEPESEAVQKEKVQFEAVIATLETLLPQLDPESRAKCVVWLCDNVNDRERLFASKLNLDEDDLRAYFETKRAEEEQMNEKVEEEPRPFARSA